MGKYIRLTLTIATLLYYRKSILNFIKKQIKNIPIVKYEIEKRMNHQLVSMENQIFHNFDPNTSIVVLQEEPLPSDSLMQPLINSYQEFQKRCQIGNFSGTVYIEPNNDFFKQLIEETSQIYKYVQYYNTMHASDFPLARQREAEVVSMVAKLYNYDKIYSEICNDKQVFGYFTSGGTESNMCAIRTYFNIAKAREIKNPVILAPISAHDSILTKGKDYGEIITVNLDPDTLKVSTKHMEKMIRKYGKRVIAIVGSTPTYAHGILDPIDELSELALKYNIYLHVDACMGSLLLPFIKSYSGFYYPGVSSVSVDPHKFGYCPKGSSVILYRSKDIMRYQFYMNPEWQGGLYTTPGLPGSKSAVNSIVTHYVMNRIGKNGYQEFANKLVALKKGLITELEKLEHIKIVGEPELSLIAIKSDTLNIYLLSDYLAQNGIKMDKMQGPPFNSIHICLTLLHLNNHFIEKFILTIKNGIQLCYEINKSIKAKDIEKEENKEKKKLDSGEAALYGQVASLNKSEPELVKMLMEEYNFTVLRALPLNLVKIEDKSSDDFNDIRSTIFKFIYKMF